MNGADRVMDAVFTFTWKFMCSEVQERLNIARYFLIFCMAVAVLNC